MSSREFAEWMAFDFIQPLPDRRAEFGVARILAALHNIHRDPKKSPDPVKSTAFMPDYWADPEPPVEEMSDADRSRLFVEDFRRMLSGGGE